jgi:hypothetical protein
MLRNAILMGLFAVIAGGASASDKPSVQARERMEAEASDRTVTVHENGTFVRERREEHPVSDVGYRRGEPIVRESRESWSRPSSNTATKPAVAARQRAEE